ncbi:MAG: hypothetical protein OXG37_01550 [Actinomycetia bacterium]|nr:hypothetical protein [Actinomycetes bacterium]
MYLTMRFWHEPGHFAEYVDRFELFNQCEVYPWIAEHGLPAVANGDFHRPDDLASWKTLVPCEKYGPALVDYLCGDGPVYLQRFAVKTRHRPLVAAA